MHSAIRLHNAISFHNNQQFLTNPRFLNWQKFIFKSLIQNLVETGNHPDSINKLQMPLEPRVSMISYITE